MACYPDQVSGDNPVGQLSLCRCPRLGQFDPVWVIATTLAGVMRTQGPTKADLQGRKSAGGMMKESRVRQVLLEQR